MISGDEIYLYSSIALDEQDAAENGGISPAAFIADLNRLSGQRKITVRINSGGGSVFGAFAIFEAIRNFQKLGHTMTCVVDGLAASGASVIAMAAPRTLMSDNALMMIHRAMAGSYGNSSDLQKTIDSLEKANARLIDVYQRKTGKPAAEIEGWLFDEKWFSAQEAIDVGLINEIVTDKTSVLDARLHETIDQCSAPKKVIDKAREPVQSLMREVFHAAAQIAEARSDAERDRLVGIAGRAAKRMLNKPGTRDADFQMVCSALRRAADARQEAYAREQSYGYGYGN